ncbi:hypothetical protein [Streptomyces sp. SID3343]|uniref:hypothetical protein n=1 Tax=Streptomyces sp. SID3343 TaxID=2690260 RepID=UPI00136C6929|nr:hypothetical protein [Streptomyces sp. SID3343]
MATSGESSRERYERAMAARKAREERTHAEEVARVNARNEILAREAKAAGADNEIRQTVLAPPDPNKSSAKQLGGILLIMLIITVLIGIAATIAASTG